MPSKQIAWGVGVMAVGLFPFALLAVGAEHLGTVAGVLIREHWHGEIYWMGKRWPFPFS